MFEEYKSLIGYLERKTILRIGRLHVRFHKILDSDKTPFYHNHPFHYISIVLRGGYTEKTHDNLLVHKKGSIIVRHKDVHHRITHAKPNTLTLFFAWTPKGSEWYFSHKEDACPEWKEHKKGVYERYIFGNTLYCKFDRYWHVGNTSIYDAITEIRPSIDQTTKGELVIGL